MRNANQAPALLTRRDILKLAGAGTAGLLVSEFLSGCQKSPASPESAPTATNTLESILSTISPSPLPTIDSLRETQAVATAIVEAEKQLRDSFGLNRVDAWPGAKIVPDKKDSWGNQNLTAATMATNYTFVTELLLANQAQISEIPTFEFLQNYVEADLGPNGEFLAFSRPDFDTWYRIMNDKDLSRTRSWALTENGQLPEAKTLQITIKEELEMVLANVYNARPSPNIVNQLYQELTRNLFVVKRARNQWGDQEDQVSTVTRYMLPADVRSNQRPVDVCTWYVSDLDRGNDYWADDKTLIKPNSSQLMPLLAISPEKPPAFAQGAGYGVAQLIKSDLYNPYWLSLTILDLDSRPDHTLFDHSATVTKHGSDDTGPGCLTVFLGQCGFGAPPVVQGSGEGEVDEKLTPAPTNVDIIPTQKPKNEKPPKRQPTQIP